MNIIVGNTYTDVQIGPNQHDFLFPDDFVGCVRPGSLAALGSHAYIEWGLSMTEPIEPRVIPKGCELSLGENYRHTFDATVAVGLKSLFIHDSNRDLAVYDTRCASKLYFWRRGMPYARKEFVDTEWDQRNWKHSGVPHPDTVYVALVVPNLASSPMVPCRNRRGKGKGQKARAQFKKQNRKPRAKPQTLEMPVDTPISTPISTPIETPISAPDLVDKPVWDDRDLPGEKGFIFEDFTNYVDILGTTDLADTVTDLAGTVTDLANTVTGVANTVTSLAKTVTGLANTVGYLSTEIISIKATIAHLTQLADQQTKPVVAPVLMPRLWSLKQSNLQQAIPSNVTHLDCSDINYNQLKQEVIPSSVTHLYVKRLTVASVIPASVTHLFMPIVDSLACVPATVTHLYIHAACYKTVFDRPHYLFYISSGCVPNSYLDKTKYEFSEQTVIRPFDRDLVVVKRTAKDPTIVELEDAIAKAQAKIMAFKRGPVVY